MKKYTVVNYYTRIPMGVFLELIPAKDLFIWHEDRGADYLYCFDETRPFFDKIADAKRSIRQYSTTLHDHLNENHSIIELDVDENERIAKISNIYKPPSWTAQPIIDGSLVGDALNRINEIYIHHMKEQEQPCVIL